MRSVIALVRASFLTATSYRLGMVLSLVGLMATVIPVYFVSGALQPLVEESIRAESGGNYFGFLIVGMSATYIFTAAMAAVPGALTGSISTGTLEALLVTRTPLPQLLIGMAGYGMLWNTVRASLLLVCAAVIGVQVSWTAVPFAMIVMLFMVVAYFSFGLLAGALILVFRTQGPFTTIVTTASGLLGGVYYSTTKIPSWLQELTTLMPLTYALHAARGLLLAGASPVDVSDDVLMIAGMAAVLLAVSTGVFVLALRYARSAGTLSQY